MQGVTPNHWYSRGIGIFLPYIFMVWRFHGSLSRAAKSLSASACGRKLGSYSERTDFIVVIFFPIRFLRAASSCCQSARRLLPERNIEAVGFSRMNQRHTSLIRGRTVDARFC